jgi:hypothetical protein
MNNNVEEKYQIKYLTEEEIIKYLILISRKK